MSDNAYDLTLTAPLASVAICMHAHNNRIAVNRICGLICRDIDVAAVPQALLGRNKAEAARIGAESAAHTACTRERHYPAPHTDYRLALGDKTVKHSAGCPLVIGSHKLAQLAAAYGSIIGRAEQPEQSRAKRFLCSESGVITAGMDLALRASDADRVTHITRCDFGRRCDFGNRCGSIIRFGITDRFGCINRLGGTNGCGCAVYLGCAVPLGIPDKHDSLGFFVSHPFGSRLL